MYDLGGDPFAARRRRLRARASPSPTSWTRSSAAAAAGGGRRAALAPPPRPGRADPARHRPRRRGLRRRAGAQGRHRGRVRARATARALRRAPRRGTCETCHGRGEIQQVQRVVPRRDPHDAPLRGLPGLRPDHPRALPRVLRRRPGPLPSHPHASRSRPASTPAPASSSPVRARSAPAAGPAGDLYVEIHVRRHPVFQRRGDDLHCDDRGPDDRGRARRDPGDGHLRRQPRASTSPVAPSRATRSRCRGSGSPTCAGADAATSSSTPSCTPRRASTTPRRTCSAAGDDARGGAPAGPRRQPLRGHPVRQAPRRLQAAPLSRRPR